MENYQNLTRYSPRHCAELRWKLAEGQMREAIRRSYTDEELRPYALMVICAAIELASLPDEPQVNESAHRLWRT